MQLARAEQREHHELIEIGAAAFDADLLAHDGIAAVAADGVIGLKHVPSAAAVFGDGNADAALILLDRLRRPAEPSLDSGELRQSRAQHILALVLRQSFVFLEVIGIDDFA